MADRSFYVAAPLRRVGDQLVADMDKAKTGTQMDTAINRIGTTVGRRYAAWAIGSIGRPNPEEAQAAASLRNPDYIWIADEDGDLSLLDGGYCRKVVTSEVRP